MSVVLRRHAERGEKEASFTAENASLQFEVSR